MRIYLPMTVADLADPDGVRPSAAHAVTRELAAALPGEDEEGLEFAALLAAADASVGLLSADPSVPSRRVVVVADVSGVPSAARAGGLPSEVEPPAAVPWDQVVSLHVDDGDAESDVAAAAAGDEEALERAAERDLLWFDVSELDDLRRLRGQS